MTQTAAERDDDQMRYIGALVNEAQVEALDKLAQRLGGCSRAAVANRPRDAERRPSDAR